MDRALAGLNRVIETDWSLVARVIWSPKRTPLNPDPSSPESWAQRARPCRATDHRRPTAAPGATREA